MKLIPHLFIASLLCAGSILSAQTDSTEGAPNGPFGRKGRSHGRGPMHPIIRVLNADRDATISAAELANAPAALRTLDANGDGTLAAEELRPQRPANAPTPPPDAPARPRREDHPRGSDPIMLALDANSDGALSAAEIANSATSLKALDANNDGALSLEELRPLPPAQ